MHLSLYIFIKCTKTNGSVVRYVVIYTGCPGIDGRDKKGVVLREETSRRCGMILFSFDAPFSRRNKFKSGLGLN